MDEDQKDVGRIVVRRRSVLGAVATVALTPTLHKKMAKAGAVPAKLANIKAITFDVQGTLVDYYLPFVSVAAALERRNGSALDWSGFLADWNARAVSIILTIVAGQRPWMPAGQVFREALDTLIASRSWNDRLDKADRNNLMSIWGKMSPWPDSVAGVRRLKERFTTAALSNASMAAVIAVTKRNGLSFDAVLSGELVHAFKPSPEVYKAAAAYLGFPAGEILMVAAHKFDLKAAKAAGFWTSYIPRPLETGPNTKVDRSPEDYIDVVAKDVVDLASRISQE